MTRQLFTITTVLIFGLLAQSVWAQAPVKTPPVSVQKQRTTSSTWAIDTAKNTDPSLKGQYQFILSRSKTINGYKLINQSRLGTVWQSVTDTLRKERAELLKMKNKVNEQQKTINNLQTEIGNKENSINDSNAKLNEISFLGISFSKTTYNIMVWTLIIILAIALTVIIAGSGKNRLEAKHRTQLYDEVYNDFQNYKTKANEKERKLARELQDERNIVEELKSRGR